MGCFESKKKPDANSDNSGYSRDRGISINREKISKIDEPLPSYNKEKKEIKISFLGDSSVGKTTFFMQLKNDFINFKDKPTQPAGNNIVKDFEIANYGTILAVIWDTAGQEAYMAVTGALIKKSNAIILTYCVDDKKTFENIEEKWIPKIWDHLDEKAIKVILIGNKID